MENASKQYIKALKNMPTAQDMWEKDKNPDVLPLGLPSVDWGVLGIGGLPFNRAIEIFGREGSGKTRFAIHACAQYHKLYKGDVLWSAPESRPDMRWMQKCGVDLSRTRMSYAKGAAKYYIQDIFAALIAGVRLIVVDAISSLIPEDITEKDSSELKMNEAQLQAKMISTFCNQLESGNRRAGRPPMDGSNAMILFINHTKRFQSDDAYYDDSKGAGKLKHFCRMRLNIEFLRMIRDEKGNVYYKPPINEGITRIQCLKNQHALPMAEAVVHLGLKEGTVWDDADSVLELGKRNGRLEVRGSYIYHGKMKWQGKEKFEEALRRMPVLAEKICRPQ